MRKHPRLDVDRACGLELSGNRKVEAHLLNVSMGGVGLESPTALADEESFTLVLAHRGGVLRLACEVRHLRDLWSRQTIHAEFGVLSADDVFALQDFIEDLLAEGPSLSAPRSLWRRVRKFVGGARAAVL